MKERLLKFLTTERLSSARFAEIIGVQPSSISHIISGRNKPGFDFIQKILVNYPSLNAEWLITGKGNMLKSDDLQGDLFSSEHSGNRVSPDDQKEVEDLPQENRSTMNKDEYKQPDTNVNNEEEVRQSDTGLDDAKKVTNVNKGKHIEKIVILYSDKSFIEYTPG